MSSSTPSASFGEAPIRVGASSFSRPAALIGGATALVALTAIATTLVVRSPATPAADMGADARGAPAVAAQALLAPSAHASKSSGKVTSGDDEVAPSDAPKPVASPERKPAAGTTSARAPQRTAAAAAKGAPLPCAQCGVVEAVTSFQQKGEGSGVGAVGGAVVGGLLGSQIGGGGGKKAMTVIGAVGGGLAGNEIEKRQRATTLYSVKVRMEDGSLRTLTQSSAPAVGQKVSVEGSTLKPRA
jgi:outer membrane lipoprotein SlyB